MFAADADVEFLRRRASARRAHAHEPPDALLVDRLERIVSEYALRGVPRQDRRGVVAREAERHLREIVRAEGEEIRAGRGEFPRDERRAGCLDHQPNLVLDRRLAGRVRNLLGDGPNDISLVDEFFDGRDEGNHDADARRRLRGDSRLVARRLATRDRRSLEDGTNLHPGHVRSRDAEAASPRAEHGVRLAERFGSLDDGGGRRAERFRVFGGEGADVVAGRGKKFVQRRIEQPYRHRRALRREKDFLEVLSLVREHSLERVSARDIVRREDHASNRARSLRRLEPHVFRARQTDPFGAVLHRRRGVLGGVGVGEHAEVLVLVRPSGNRRQVPRRAARGFSEPNRAADHLAGFAVDAQDVALAEGFRVAAVERHRFPGLVDAHRIASHHARFAPSSRDDRGVTRLPSSRREYASRGVHAADVLRGGLRPHEKDVFFPRAARLGFRGVEHDGADRGPRARRESLRDHIVRVQILGVEGWVKKLVHVPRFDRRQRLRYRAESLVHHLNRDAERASTGALPRATLKDVQLLALDRELDVHHVLEVFFERVAIFLEFRERGGKPRHKRVDGLGSSNARHDVLALRAHKKFTEESLLAGGRVAREAHPGCGLVARVAENHRLDVHGRAAQTEHPIYLAVLDGAIVVPRSKHRLDRHLELLERIRGKRATMFRVHRLVISDQRLETRRVEIGVVCDVRGGFRRRELRLERLVRDAEDDVAEHIKQTSVCVERETAFVVRGGTFEHRRNHFIVQADVENGIHHAGHGRRGAAADGDEQRRRPLELGRGRGPGGGFRGGRFREPREAPSHTTFDVRDPLTHLVPHGGECLARRVGVASSSSGGVELANLGRYREAGRNVQPDTGHLREAGALTPEEVLHRLVAVGGASSEAIRVLDERAARGAPAGAVASWPEPGKTLGRLRVAWIRHSRGCVQERRHGCAPRGAPREVCLARDGAPRILPFLEGRRR